MYEVARPSSRSKPRRLRIPSKKSVSAEACNWAMRACASASLRFSRRISAPASPDAADRRDPDANAPLRRFEAPEAAVVVFFFMSLQGQIGLLIKPFA